MSDLFQIGEEASRGKLVTQLETLRAQGEQVLAQLEAARLETLMTFERRLAALNGRRQRANRILAPRVAARFVVSDLLDLDQAQTTATVRADVQAVTLRERQTPVSTVVRAQRFAVTSGAAEAMDTAGNLYRVYADDGSVPTGTFELELAEPLNLALLVFDLAAMPSEPTITVEVSTTGTTYTPATQTQVNGYRLTAWLAPQVVRFVRLHLTPSHPDTLGGRSYTFGLTDFSGSTVEFHLLSELVTRAIDFRPSTTHVRLVADADPGLTYFLAFNGGGFMEVRPGEAIDVPGVALLNNGHGVTDIAVDTTTGLLAHTLPADAYPETLSAAWEGRLEVPVYVVPGFVPSARDSRLTGNYVGINGTALYFTNKDRILDPDAWSGKTFTLHYTTGPAQVTVQLKVQLTTSDRAVTPVFRGAVLEEI